MNGITLNGNASLEVKEACVIFECEYRCEDCENEVGSHNTWHLPHYTFEFGFWVEPDKFAGEIKKERDFASVQILEIWTEEEMKSSMGGLFPLELSWTQMAIARCNEMGR